MACRPSLATLILLLAPGARAQSLYTAFESFIKSEMADKQLPALSIALVDDQRIVWQRDFGATGHTVHRVGSVSKLFTDIRIMQLVERGELDLDAPVTKYLPAFRHPITLRQLMSHRSGLTREPPVGNYFDATGPTLAATVESPSSTELIYPPGTHTKYSNSGIAVVGYVLEQTQKQPFARYLKRAVLDPVGTSESSISPAGSLYSTVGDLAKPLSVLFAGGRPVLRRQTLERMWEKQSNSDFGLGFALSEFEGHRRIRHGGAIYGFATELTALPDQKLGAEALRLMLAMSERSYPDYPGGTSLQRWHRALLRRTMEAEGFTVFDVEWWHFDYKDWKQYGIGNIPFEQVSK